MGKSSEEEQVNLASMIAYDSLRTMRIRVAGACGGNARSVGDDCRSAQVTRSASQPGAVRTREAGGRWPSGPQAVSNEARLGAAQVGRSFTEGRPVNPLSFIHFFSNKFQSSGFKNTNHFLT
jgi:hypothetical protein